MKRIAWLLLLVGCDRNEPVMVVPPPAAVEAAAAPIAEVAPVRAAPQVAAAGEGGASPERVFERARRAVEQHDYAELYRSVAPGTRDGWMHQMVLSVMFATMGKMGSPLDQIMQRHHATLTLEQRLGGLDVAQMSDALLAHVDDRAALFGELMTYAQAHGGAVDPMKAFPSQVVQMQIAPGKGLVDGISDSIKNRQVAPIEVSGPPGLPRLIALLGARAPLGEVRRHGGSASATLKVGKEKSALRFVEQGAKPAWFVDES